MHIRHMTIFGGVPVRSRRHRLLVVVPVFALVAALTVREGVHHRAAFSSMDAITASAADTPREVALDDGTLLQLQPFASVAIQENDVTLERGSMIVATHGTVRIRVGEVLVSVWSGGMHLSHEESGTTIAALRAPAVVRLNGSTMIVPAGMQWRVPADPAPFTFTDIASWRDSRDAMPLPESFVRETSGTVEALMNRIVVSLEVRTDADAPALALPRFAAAASRMEQAENDARLAAMLTAFTEHDAATMQSLLLDPAFPLLIANDAAKPFLPLLMHAAATQGMTEAFIGPFLELPDAWLLSALHPLLRDHAWTTDMHDSLNDEERLMVLLSLPQSDTLPDSLTELAVRRWGAAWMRYLEVREDPAGVLSQALPILEAHIHRLHRLNYPARVRQYEEAVREVAASYEDHLTAEALQALRTIEELSDPSASLESIEEMEQEMQVTEDVSEDLEETVAIPAAEALSRAKAILAEYGFMFTADTVLGYREPAFVDITGAVLGTVKGDKLLSFTLDVATGEVSGIMIDGGVSPYGMPLARYVEWVKAEARP